MLTQVEQFKNTEGRAALVKALRGMALLRDSPLLAEAVAARAEVVSTPEGTVLIEEGAAGSDMYFVLSGRLQLIVNHREYALLEPGSHVGEYSLIDPGALRSATVRTLEETVTARLSAEAFGEIAERHPSLWQSVSQVLGSHLREGNRYLRRPNARPRVSICASPIGQFFAQAIQAQASDSEQQVPNWIVETHCPARESFEGLERALVVSDLGVIVIAPGELEALQKEDSHSDRDALLLCCGISVGALGRNRTMIVQPETLGEASPAHSLGLTALVYRLDPPHAIKSDLEAICRDLRTRIQEDGPRLP